MYSERKILSYGDLVAKNQLKNKIERFFQADSYIFIFFALIVLASTTAYVFYTWYENNRAELPVLWR